MAAPPGMDATTDDQGYSSTCTRFALSKAVVECLDDLDIDIRQTDICAYLVNQQTQKVSEGKWATDFDKAGMRFQDPTSRGWHFMTMAIKKSSLDDFKADAVHPLQSSSFQAGLHTRGEKYVLNWTTSAPPPHNSHCVYAKCWEKKKGTVLCLNSWGETDPEPHISPGSISCVYSVSLVVQASEGGDIEAMSAFPGMKPYKMTPEALQVCKDLAVTFTVPAKQQWKMEEEKRKMERRAADDRMREKVSEYKGIIEGKKKEKLDLQAQIQTETKRRMDAETAKAKCETLLKSREQKVLNVQKLADEIREKVSEYEGVIKANNKEKLNLQAQTQKEMKRRGEVETELAKCEKMLKSREQKVLNVQKLSDENREKVRDYKDIIEANKKEKLDLQAQTQKEMKRREEAEMAMVELIKNLELKNIPNLIKLLTVDTLTVSSSGPAATKLPWCMGQYRRLEGVTARGRPVWRKGEEELYFYYDSYGWWRIGRDYKEASGWMIRSEETGLSEIPLTGWRYSTRGLGWPTDPGLTVMGGN